MDRDNYPFSVPTAGINDAKQIYKKHSKEVIIIIIIASVVLLGVASYYQIDPDEVGVVTRFGRYTETTMPGPHFKIPVVDEVQTVPAKRQLKQEFGFRTDSAGVKSEFIRNQVTLKESMMLTGDLNVAVVEWIVHYKIEQPRFFVFNVRNVVETLRALSEATMRRIIGDYSVTEVLTTGREELLEQARQHLGKLCTLYETGIAIQRIELKDSAPPDPVKPSFNEVNQAEQERDRLQNEAWAKYNRAIPKARGQAQQAIQEAEGYAIERVNNGQGEVKRFLEIQREYARAPKVTRSRLYLETLQQVLPAAGKKIIVDAKASGVMPMLLPMGNNKMQPPTQGATVQGGAR